MLYCLNENMEQDFEAINHFLTGPCPRPGACGGCGWTTPPRSIPPPSAGTGTTSSACPPPLTEPIDVPVLRAALDVTVRRFPSMAVRLRRGVFWYYLEEIPSPGNPAGKELPPGPRALRPGAALRLPGAGVSQPGGSGVFPRRHRRHRGLIFLKTLVAEYLCQKYGITVPAEKGVLGRLEEPAPGAGGQLPALCRGCYRQPGGEHRLSPQRHPGKGRYKNLVTMMVPVDRVRACARQYGVTVTELLCAAMMQAIADLQAEKVPGAAAASR